MTDFEKKLLLKLGIKAKGQSNYKSARRGGTSARENLIRSSAVQHAGLPKAARTRKRTLTSSQRGYSASRPAQLRQSQSWGFPYFNNETDRQRKESSRFKPGIGKG